MSLPHEISLPSIPSFGQNTLLLLFRFPFPKVQVGICMDFRFSGCQFNLNIWLESNLYHSVLKMYKATELIDELYLVLRQFKST